MRDCWPGDTKTEPVLDLGGTQALVERDAFGVGCLYRPVDSVAAMLKRVLGYPGHECAARSTTALRTRDIELFELSVTAPIGFRLNQGVHERDGREADDMTAGV